MNAKSEGCLKLGDWFTHRSRDSPAAAFVEFKLKLRFDKSSDGSVRGILQCGSKPRTTERPIELLAVVCVKWRGGVQRTLAHFVPPRGRRSQKIPQRYSMQVVRFAAADLEAMGLPPKAQVPFEVTAVPVFWELCFEKVPVGKRKGNPKPIRELRTLKPVAARKRKLQLAYGSGTAKRRKTKGKGKAQTQTDQFVDWFLANCPSEKMQSLLPVLLQNGVEDKFIFATLAEDSLPEGVLKRAQLKYLLSLSSKLHSQL